MSQFQIQSRCANTYRRPYRELHKHIMKSSNKSGMSVPVVAPWLSLLPQSLQLFLLSCSFLAPASCDLRVSALCDAAVSQSEEGGYPLTAMQWKLAVLIKMVQSTIYWLVQSKARKCFKGYHSEHFHKLTCEQHIVSNIYQVPNFKLSNRTICVVSA